MGERQEGRSQVKVLRRQAASQQVVIWSTRSNHGRQQVHVVSYTSVGKPVCPVHPHLAPAHLRQPLPQRGHQRGHQEVPPQLAQVHPRGAWAEGRWGQGRGAERTGSNVVMAKPGVAVSCHRSTYRYSDMHQLHYARLWCILAAPYDALNPATALVPVPCPGPTRPVAPSPNDVRRTLRRHAVVQHLRHVQVYLLVQAGDGGGGRGQGAGGSGQGKGRGGL